MGNVVFGAFATCKGRRKERESPKASTEAMGYYGIRAAAVTPKTGVQVSMKALDSPFGEV